MSKLGDFMKKEKIDARRVLASSAKLENFTRGDYKVRLAKKQAKDASASDQIKELAKTERRTGRPLTRPSLDAAIKGDAIPGPVKTKIIRAVNRVRGQQKKAEVALKDLF